MNRYAPLLTLFIVAMSLCAADVRVKPVVLLAPDLSETELETCTAQLASEKFEVREAAFVKLLGQANRALPAITKAITAAKDEEHTKLLKQLADRCDPGGKIVDGVSIRVSCTNPTVTVGERLKIHFRVNNYADHPQIVPLGDSVLGSPSYWTLYDMKSEMCSKNVYAKRPKEMFCGMDTGSVQVELPALGCFEGDIELHVLAPEPFDKKALLKEGENRRDLPFPHTERCWIPYHSGENELGFASMRNVNWKMFTGKLQSFEGPTGTFRSASRIWPGSAVSNTLKITVKEK